MANEVVREAAPSPLESTEWDQFDFFANHNDEETLFVHGRMAVSIETCNLCRPKPFKHERGIKVEVGLTASHVFLSSLWPIRSTFGGVF